MMNTMNGKMSQSFLIAAVLTVLLAVAGCNDGGSSKPNTKVSGFESDEALTAYLKEQYATSATPSPVRYYLMETDAAAPEAGGADKGFSGTNIQEAGVDESDVVKTDGEYLYIANDSDVCIVAARPADAMHVVSYVKAGGWIDSIYLYGDTLVVIYRPSSGEDYPILYRAEEKIAVGMPYWIPHQEKTGILIADVSNPAQPSTIKDIQVDGYLVASRITGGRLHVVAQYMPSLPQLEIWYDGSEMDKEAVTEANKQVLASLTLDDFIPKYTVCDAGGEEEEKGRAIATEDFIRPREDNGGSMVSIITIDMENPAADFKSTAFVADVQNIYASTEALYLVSTIYHYADEGSTDDGGEVSFVWANPTFETQIYKFDLGDSVSYSAEGRVDGEILNQFSLGEYKGVLRIATTTGATWDGTSKNHVFCLQNNGEPLNVIGSIRDLAPGERLYSARFMGDRGYLVTFVQVDPLFTLDLSDPANPRVAGELKVPGYATYLHPLNENTLLSIGQDTTLEGDIVKNGGMQLSIYDTSDFSNPQLLHTAKIGDSGTYSEAMYNHKAIAFWPERDLLALPVNEYAVTHTEEGDLWENSFNGMVVYRLTEDYDFELLGRMNLYTYDEHDATYYYPSWYRGVFIEDDFYAMTSHTVKAAPVADIKEPFDTLDLMK